MEYEHYKGACDSFIKSLYHFTYSTTFDKDWQLKMTEKQRTILLRMAKKAVEILEEDTVIIPEKPPQKVKVRKIRKMY